MGYLQIDTVNLPEDILYNIVMKDSQMGRMFVYFTHANSRISGMEQFLGSGNYTNMLISGRGYATSFYKNYDFLRLYVPTGLSGLTSAELVVPFEYFNAVYKNYISVRPCVHSYADGHNNDMSLWIADVDEWATYPELVQSVTTNNPTTISLNPDFFEGNSTGYVDLLLSLSITDIAKDVNVRFFTGWEALTQVSFILR